MRHSMRKKTKRPTAALIAFAISEDAPTDALTLPPREPPREFRIFHAGENTALKEPGTFMFDEQAAASVMEAFARQGRGFLNFDYEHGATLGDGNPKPSAGRWVPEIRNGELWATQCQWTERAAQLIASREYELFSPWFTHEPEAPYRVLTILNCALTNTPALENAMPLIAASTATGDDMDPKDKEIEELKAALAKASKETEELKASVASLTSKLAAEDDKEEEKEEELKAAMSLKTSLVAVTGKASVAAALGVVEAWKTKAAVADKLTAEVEAAKSAKLSAEFEALFTSVKDQAQKAKEAGATVAAVNKVIESVDEVRAKALALGGGKVNASAMDFATAALSFATATLSSAPSVPGKELAPSGGLQISQSMLSMGAKLGLSPDEIRKRLVAKHLERA